MKFYERGEKMENPLLEKAGLGDLRLIRLVPDDDVLKELHKKIGEIGWFRAAVLSCVGSLKEVTFRNPKREASLPIGPDKTMTSEVKMPCEILSIQGNVFPKGDEIVVHLHGIVGQPDGTTVGGHILAATVFTTCEMVLAQITGAKSTRKTSDVTGLDELSLPEGLL
jgi:predicted DNA-binding protein with PD1-like motif